MRLAAKVKGGLVARRTFEPFMLGPRNSPRPGAYELASCAPSGHSVSRSPRSWLQIPSVAAGPALKDRLS